MGFDSGPGVGPGGDAPNLDLAIGYDKVNISPVLQLFFSGWKSRSPSLNMETQVVPVRLIMSEAELGIANE